MISHEEDILVVFYYLGTSGAAFGGSGLVEF